jgi:arylformamidase
MAEAQKIWRGMDRAELDRAYDNRAAVPNSAEIIEDWVRRSERFRAEHAELLDLPYGPRARNRIDLYRCGREEAPLLAFIHGGYWQRNSKETFACFAEGPLARGLDVAMLGYTLAPEATLTEIVAEIAEAVRWLRGDGASYGVGRGRLILSGWSAGGHLTAANMGLPEVDAGLAISGIYDVEPCRLGILNDALRLTPEESRAMSPQLHLPQRTGPLVVAYGAGELPELQRQSRDYAAALTEAGLPNRLLPLEGHDHFSIMQELASPNGRLTEAAVELAQS